MGHSEHHINFLEVLDGMKFPVTKAEVILHAEAHGASEEVLDRLQGIPDDDYKTRDELLENINVIEEVPGFENLWSSAESGDYGSSDEEQEGRDIV
jgi:hypothetical protein